MANKIWFVVNRYCDDNLFGCCWYAFYAVLTTFHFKMLTQSYGRAIFYGLSID